MKKTVGLAGVLLVLALSAAGCQKKQDVPEVYLDESIPETPVAVFTQNDLVSDMIQECCEKVMRMKDCHTGSFF